MLTAEAKKDPRHLFTLKFELSDEVVLVHAFHMGQHPVGGNSEKIEVEVVDGDGRDIVFPRGQLYCGTPRFGGMTVDGIKARELVGSLVAMRPGDTDSSYFEGYNQDQLDFAQRYGEEIAMEVMNAYCDNEGNVRDDLDSEDDPLEDR